MRPQRACIPRSRVFPGGIGGEVRRNLESGNCSEAVTRSGREFPSHVKAAIDEVCSSVDGVIAQQKSSTEIGIGLCHQFGFCQKSNMVNNLKHSMVDTNEGLDLDPLVWQELPLELLERVITKLPFSRVVAFRTVCKHWYSDIIPHTARHGQASNRAALLYFGSSSAFDDMPKGSPWWVQVGSSESEGASLVQKFEHKSFPPVSNAEEFQLMICEHGLLFFGLVTRQDNMVRDFFVCNPLTSQSRSLGLPRPLKPPRGPEWRNTGLLSGTVFDSKTRSYRLVVAGEDEIGEFVTYLYDSLSSAWTTGSSLLPAILEVRSGIPNLRIGSSRSVYSRGNLYWYATSCGCGIGARNIVLKFDIQLGSWRLIPDINMLCCDDLLDAKRMALYKGEITLWHLHNFLYGDDPDDDDDQDWPCRAHREIELAPEIKFMEPDMIERVDRSLSVQTDGQAHPASDRYKYFAFGQRNFIYHVMQFLTPVDDAYALPYELWVKIVLQETNENSFTELARVSVSSFPSGRFSAFNLWSFIPSLTSVP